MKNALWLAACAVGLSLAAKPVEESELFERFVDPVSGVVSYLVKPGLAGYNQQGLYYTQRSMTDDGRFLIFSVAPDENVTGKKVTRYQRLAIADLEKGKITVLDDFMSSPCTPGLDTVKNTVTYMKRKAGELGVFRRHLAEPLREEKVCDTPANVLALGKIGSYYTHLSFSHDRTKIFLDMCCAKTNGINGLSVGGTLDITTGIFREWYRDKYIVRHGEINPVRDELALALKPYGDSHKQVHDCGKEGVCRRLMLYTPASARMIIPKVPEGGKAPVHVVHTAWTPDGKSIYWCAYSNGVIIMDVDTGEQQVLMKDNCAVHCALSPDGRYLVFDEVAGEKRFRGQEWKIGLYDLKAKTTKWIFSHRPPLGSPEKPSHLHPDPHPHFAQGMKYIVSTVICGEPGRMTVAVTPMAQFETEKAQASEGKKAWWNLFW